MDVVILVLKAITIYQSPDSSITLIQCMCKILLGRCLKCLHSLPTIKDLQSDLMAAVIFRQLEGNQKTNYTYNIVFK